MFRVFPRHKLGKTRCPRAIIMSFFKLNDHVFGVDCAGSIVILDVINDEYIFLDNLDSQSLRNSLKLSATPNPRVRTLVSLGVIKIDKRSRSSYLRSINEPLKDPLSSEILSKINSYPRNIEKDKEVGRWLVFLAWNILMIVSILLKMKGLSLVLRYVSYLKNLRKNQNNLKKICHVINAVNRASYWSLTKVKCLEWSLACVIFSLQNNLLVYFFIGVTRNPFIAHAWIESKNGPIADDVDCKKYFYTIFSTKGPFCDY